MKEEFKKGIVVGMTIYLAFAIITIVTHLITGWDYPHGPIMKMRDNCKS